VHRFLFIYQFPKSNVLYFKFRMRDPLKESISCFLIRLSPLVLVPNGLFHRTQRPLLYDFMGLKVLAFIFHRIHSPLSFTFRRLQCLQSFTLSKDYNVFIYISKTSMSLVIYAFKRLQCLHLHFKDFNVLSHLRF